MAIRITINGQTREFADPESVATIAGLVVALDLKADRVAVEHNGNLATRTTWAQTNVSDGDRIELVHFVGGGAGS